MYSSYSAAAFALRSARPSYNNAHSSSSYLPSHHCQQQYDADGGQRDLVPLNPHLSPRFLLDGNLLRHSAHLLLLSARLQPPPPPHPPHCCHRRAAARCCCCSGGGARSYPQHVPWRSEASAPRCCGQRTVRSDLGVVCRRFKARGCGCGSSGSATLCLGTGCGNRGAPRLLARAVRQEVWEYDGGEWPHRRCSMECHDDWDDEDQCDLAEWELPGRSRFRRRMSKEEEDDERCRDCRRRKKGVENHYYDEGEYSGRRREIGDVSGSLRSARGRLEQRGYLDDEDMRRRREMPEERDRREFDFDDARRVGARRYNEDDRKYDRRRERRDSEYDDVFDAGRLRAGRYTEDDRKFDRRTERRDFEIDNEGDVRRDGRRHRNDNELFEIRNTGRKKYREEEDVSSLGSRRWHDNESYNDDQYIAERKDYSRGRSQSSASAFHKDDSQRVSSSRNNVDTSLARENTSLRVRWDDNVDRRAAHTSEERDRRYSSYVGLSNDEKDEYDHEIERLVRVRDSRTGTKDVKVITEDDTSLNSSSKNSSILKQHRDVDQQVAARNESKRISQRIMETSEVRGNNTELDSAMLRNHQEDKRNYIDNKSSSLQSSVNIANGSRRQINRHDEVEVDQQVITLTDSRKNSEKLTDIKMDSSHNVSRASHSHRNYEEVNQMDINDKSTSIENITHIVRDKKRYVNQQVIHETDIDVQNVTHVDVSTVRASDISMLRNSQNNSETRSDVNSISNTSLIDWAVQQEQTHQNKIIASDRATVAGSQSHHNTEMYGQVHSASVIGSKKEMQEQVELTKARTNNAAMTSTSESHIGTRIDDRFQPSSSVHTASTVKGQTDLTKNHASGTVVVSNSHNRTDSQARRTSAFNLVEARDSRDKSDLQITQGSSDSEISDEARTRFSESSQDSREILTRVEETGRLMKHNMALNSQQASTRRISDTEDTTSLQIESSEEASTVNLDMEQRGTILERTETTATESIPGDSSPRNSVNESVLESAARLEKSSTFHVGQFVGELQRGTSDADTTSTMKNEKSIMEGITRSSSRSRMKGPSDEIWDVQSTTSQETFKTADKEEGSSADGGANSASQTPKNETAIAKKVHKSLWSYVADIVRLGWVQRGESHESSNKSFKKSSSSNSQSPDGWLSSQGHDNDSIEKKNWSIKRNDHQLTKSHSGESESIAASKKDESLPTGTQGLQISAAGNVREVGRSKGDFVPTVSKDGVQISGEKAKQSEVGASPKGNTMGRSAEDSISTLVDVTIGQPLEDEAASSSRITAQASAEINAGKGVSTGTSSMTIEAEEAGRNDDSGSWRYGPSVAIAPYHIPQTQTMIPHEHTPSTSLESTKFPTGGPPGMEEKNVVRMAPEFMRTEGKEAEINRRKIQRNKQVLKETFEEWEEAYQHDAEQRKTDELFMREALLEAQRAADIWEVPVGAVLVHNGEIIARGCNLVEDLRDSTAHAEIVCIREASTKLKTWRLADTTLYVTLEPCAMCAGAILQARVDTVVWGAPNKLLGADGSWVRLFPGDGQTSTLDPANQNLTAGPVHPFHPKIVVRRGVLSTECSEIMQQFFQLRRKKKQRPESPPRAHLSGRHHHPIKFFTKVHHMFGAVFCL